MTSAFGEEVWWYIARSGGIVALVLSAASVLWGLLLSSRYLKGGPKPAGLLNLHKFLGALTIVFSLVHLLGLYFDSYVEFGIAELLVPFRSAWKPVEVAAGVIAFWLLVAVQATSLVMKRLPRRLWKWIHLGSYVMLPLGIVHGITAGTDADASWYQLLSGGLIGLLAFLTAWRAWMVPGRRKPAVKAAAPTRQSEAAPELASRH